MLHLYEEGIELVAQYRGLDTTLYEKALLVVRFGDIIAVEVPDI